ncbi:VWA domain-containing protein [Candidatus Poribacteria bacterium]|nr:VWA domain-containing protein [Candidatus Poribacteria bacterium]
MEFRDPWFLLFLLIVPVLIFRYLRNQRGTVRFSSINNLKDIKSTWSLWARHVLIFLQCFTVILLVFALARPQKGRTETRITTEGIDIVLAVDISGSMLAEDFQIGNKHYNRLYAVKEVVRDFIKGRQNDRIGIVTFAKRPYTLCPLTLDYGWLIQQLDRAEIGMIEDGTAIGSAVAISTNRLRASDAKSKIIILLTDGRNNAGRVDPVTAAEAASALNIKIYTIGAGTKGLAPFPSRDFFGNKVYRQVKIEIDEDSLRMIADKTSGKYFRATDTESLRNIYEEIDEMEKTEIETTEYLDYREFYPHLIFGAIISFVLFIILSNTVFRRLP